MISDIHVEFSSAFSHSHFPEDTFLNLPLYLHMGSDPPGGHFHLHIASFWRKFLESQIRERYFNTTICLHLQYVRFVNLPISPIYISDLEVTQLFSYSIYWFVTRFIAYYDSGNKEYSVIDVSYPE